MINEKAKGLRVLLAGPYPPPFGGIASHITTLIPGLAERGASDIALVQFGASDSVKKDGIATIYTFNVKQNFKLLLKPGNWIFFWTGINILPKRLGLRAIVTEAIKALLINQTAKKHHINVASFYQVDHSLSLLLCSRVWKRKRGIVLTVFGEVYDEVKFFSENQDLVKKIINAPQALASSSCHCANGYSSFKAAKKIEPVYYGVDLERFEDSSPGKSFRDKHKIADDDILLFYMGRFSELMGLDRLLQIIPDILGEHANVKFLLAGAKGPLSGDAEKCRSAYPERIIVMNDISFEIQPSIYAASDVVLAPTRDKHACMGMSIKEAMAAAKPVIGSEAGGVPEAIVNGETGLLIPLDHTQNIDALKFKAGISQLVQDATLRMRMGKNARLRAEAMFSMDKTIDRMAEIFRSTILKTGNCTESPRKD